MTRLRPCIALSLLLPLAACEDTTQQTLTTLGDTNEVTEVTEISYTGFDIRVELLGRHATGVFDDGGAEIVAFHAPTQRVFSVNASAGTVDVIDVADPATPVLENALDASADVTAAVAGNPAMGFANSVSVSGNLVAVAIEADVKQDHGYVAFYNATTLAFRGAVEVGALPDMVTFAPDGNTVLVANEGEPSDDYTVDPEGTVSLIDISGGIGAASVQTVSFTDFNLVGSRAAELPATVRIFGPGATVAQDLEPEYITVDARSRTAWVTLQENNAIARIDLATATVDAIYALGFKDHRLPGNELDPSDRNGVLLGLWPVFGMYMPDSIASYQFNGDTYLVTANEGDARDYAGFAEESRVSALTLDATLDPAATLKAATNLGRLNVTTTLGDTGTDGDYEALYAFGARSFSIWNADGAQVFDSGNAFERLLAQRQPARFNSDHASNSSVDSRSDNKGPEPEAIEVGTINGRVFAFIGLERDSGIMVWDITNPESPHFVQYLNSRNYAVDADDAAAGDLGPESIRFVDAAASPTGKPMLVVGNEVSGTVALYGIDIVLP